MYETIRHHSIPAGFTGIVYADSGKLNYAPVIGGQYMKRKDGKARWFRSSDAAAKAIDNHKSAIEDQLNDFNWVGSRHHY